MKKGKSRYIVVDTNVIISAGILPNSTTAKMLAIAFDNFILAQNAETWDELITRIKKKKLDRYFEHANSRAAYLLRVNANTGFFDIKTVATECSDPTDNKFLGLAMDAGATIIVTGDSDLQVLHPCKGISIYSPADFFRLYQ